MHDVCMKTTTVQTTPNGSHKSRKPPAAGRGTGRLLDRKGAAKYLNVSERSLDRLIETGQLPVVMLPVERSKTGGHGVVGTFGKRLIDTPDLDALIERSKETLR